MTGFKLVYIRQYCHAVQKIGGVAQMVERSLSMREVRGSMPRTSTTFCPFLVSFLVIALQPFHGDQSVL